MDLLLNYDAFSEPQRLKLAGMLRDPDFVLACNYVIRKSQPTPTFALKATESVRAAKASQLSGMTELLIKLDDLAQPVKLTPEQAAASELAEWGHVTPEPSVLDPEVTE